MNNFSLITDASNRYYAGMTLDDARKLGIEKSFWRRDFHNIDKDKDGILSAGEIIKERRRSSKINKITAAAFAGLGIFEAITEKSKKWLIVTLSLDAFIIASALAKALKIDDKTKKYEYLLLQNSIDKFEKTTSEESIQK